MKDRQYSWVKSVVVLSFGWLLLYATRTVLSSTLKDIGDYWGLSEGFLGLISSSFFMAYTILQIPSGFLSDRFGSKRVLLLGFAAQSLAIFFSAFARDQYQFLGARVLAGAGQATYFACQHAIISVILPKERRALGTAATVAGSALGTALGLLLGKFLGFYSFGWRLPFAVLGAMALAFVLAIALEVPETSGPHSVYPMKFINSSPSGDGARQIAQAPQLPDNLGQANPGWTFLALMCASHFMTMYGFYLMLTWLPYYLETVRGYRGGLSAVIPTVMPLIMAPATLAGGFVADRLGSKKVVVNVALPLSALATAAIPLVKSTGGLLAALALYGATGKLVIDPGLIAYVGDNAPLESRATILSIFNFAGALAMAVAPAATGFLAESTGSFDLSFYAAGLFNIVALFTFAAALKLLGNASRYGERA
ncbi:MAG: MFS transporter [Candidatus Fermentithermobacillus carboniphilus]|uniref:MFS transporter n=1 Tax=Candidatus Fermentithermobacillus carboniphilus TaxID=3085328 RepID=A0AAT9LB49_9FIRM|nr:MAG: MFS transporter [Candidatus Fermentithermobacillus carboniphilus]